MKTRLALFSLLVLLSVPAMASPRDDDPLGRRVVSRVVHVIKKLVGAAIPPLPISS
jgi:hypothetical protein